MTLSLRIFIALGLITTQIFALKGLGLRYSVRRKPLSVTLPTTPTKETSSIPSWVNDTNRAVIGVIKDVLSSQFEGEGREFARFYALETIARVPYFSYTSVLHLYETVGQFRNKDYIKLHFSESWNELHHLLIMEELGGASLFKDRFVATHMAFFYYWIVVALYMVSPASAYNFNSHVEHHAFATYDAFIKDNEAALKAQPVPRVALDYYGGGGGGVDGGSTLFSDRSFLSQDTGEQIQKPPSGDTTTTAATTATTSSDTTTRGLQSLYVFCSAFSLLSLFDVSVSFLSISCCLLACSDTT
jgi:hypothetical protein